MPDSAPLDVLIIGSGATGLSLALQLPTELRIAVVAKRGIRFIRLLFCDIVGFPKCVTITSEELEASLATLGAEALIEVVP